MSSKRFATPFRVVLQRSILLSVLLLLMHGGALYWLSLFALPLWLKLIFSVCVIVSVVVQLRTHLLQKGRRAVTGLQWDGGEEWQLQIGSGEILTARLLGSSFVSSWLIVLNFRIVSGRGSVPVMLMPDSIDAASFRRLTAKLRRITGRVDEPLA